jgi:glutathione S-transferase
LTLYESRAICKYLARKFSFPLIPAESDFKAMALFDQAQSIELQYFAEPASQIAFQKFAKRMMGLPADEEVVATALKSLASFFDVMEQILAATDYVAGEKFTLVDLCYIPPVQRLFDCGYHDIIESHKALSAWWQRCIDRPAVQMVLAADKMPASVLSK